MKFLTKIRENYIQFKSDLTNEEIRLHIQFMYIFNIISLVSYVMTIINAITGYRSLMYATLIFGVLSTIDIVLTYFFKKIEEPIRYIFGIEFCVLIIYFIISGQPEGFSTIWACLFAVGAALLYQRKNGTIYAMLLLAIIIFFFWTPFGVSLLQYQYTKSFKLRFPFLYIAFYLIGMCFESIRYYTSKELNTVKDMYKKQSLTDQLTDLGNEAAYIAAKTDIESNLSEHTKLAIAVMDVNGVKYVDDTYGHLYGCNLIVTAGKTLPSIFKSSMLFHVGGDEFIAIIEGEDFDKLDERMEKYHDELYCKKLNYKNQELTLSVAIGVAKYKKGQNYKDLFQEADNLMYENKQIVKKELGIKSRKE